MVAAFCDSADARPARRLGAADRRRLGGLRLGGQQRPQPRGQPRLLHQSRCSTWPPARCSSASGSTRVGPAAIALAAVGVVAADPGARPPAADLPLPGGDLLGLRPDPQAGRRRRPGRASSSSACMMAGPGLACVALARHAGRRRPSAVPRTLTLLLLDGPVTVVAAGALRLDRAAPAALDRGLPAVHRPDHGLRRRRRHRRAPDAAAPASFGFIWAGAALFVVGAWRAARRASERRRRRPRSGGARADRRSARPTGGSSHRRPRGRAPGSAKAQLPPQPEWPKVSWPGP